MFTNDYVRKHPGCQTKTMAKRFFMIYMSLTLTHIEVKTNDIKLIVLKQLDIQRISCVATFTTRNVNLELQSNPMVKGNPE